MNYLRSFTVLACWVACLLAVACVSAPTDDTSSSLVVGGTYQDEEAELAMTERGDFMVTLSHITSPVEVRLNPRYPRTLKFVGVEAPDPERDRENYLSALDAVRDYAGRRQLLFVRPQVGTSPRAEVIFGRILIPMDPQHQSFRDLSMAMLEQGLLRIRDEREFQDPKVIEAMRAAEATAKQHRRGIWK